LKIFESFEYLGIFQIFTKSFVRSASISKTLDKRKRNF